ncbi:hypothetical protein BH09DEP1_BH09DEP1_3420 [soil metagenome]
MLHWQVPKWLSTLSLEARVIISSSVLHLLVLLGLFVVYQGSSQYHITISGNMINPDSEIVFMPLHRSLQQGGGAKGGAASSGVAKKAPASSAQTEKSKEMGGTTLVKIVKPKPKPKPKAKKETASKKVDSKNTKETKAEPAKPQVEHAKPEAKKEPPVQNKLEPVVESSIAAAESNVTGTSTAGAIGDGKNITYLGQAEMDALQAQDYIQQELAEHWSPPAGMRSDLFATVTIMVDYEGLIQKVDLVTSSGNLLFDTAAKKAAAQITPARWTFGKELSITFKP